MNEPSMKIRAFDAITSPANIMRQFFLNASMQNSMFDISPFQIVINHFFFRVSRKIIISFKNLLSNFLKN